MKGKLMKYSTGRKLLINLYRTLVVVLVFIPPILNIIIEADLVTSLIYSPLFILFLAFYLVYLDKKIIALLLINHKKNTTTRKLFSAEQQFNKNSNQQLWH